jgi:hypothetical protein
MLRCSFRPFYQARNSLVRKTILQVMQEAAQPAEEAEAEEEAEEGEEAALPPRRPPRLDHDPLPDYPADLLID